MNRTWYFADSTLLSREMPLAEFVRRHGGEPRPESYQAHGRVDGRVAPLHESMTCFVVGSMAGRQGGLANQLLDLAGRFPFNWLDSLVDAPRDLRRILQLGVMVCEPTNSLVHRLPQGPLKLFLDRGFETWVRLSTNIDGVRYVRREPDIGETPVRTAVRADLHANGRRRAAKSASPGNSEFQEHIDALAERLLDQVQAESRSGGRSLRLKIGIERGLKGCNIPILGAGVKRFVDAGFDLELEISTSTEPAPYQPSRD